MALDPIGADDPSGRTVQEDLTGVVIGPYEVVSFLARGGMGRIYRARHKVLGRDCVIKMLEPNLARRAEIRARFHREVRIGAMLDHRNIITVHDAVMDDPFSYLVMEYFSGIELAKRFRDRPAWPLDVLRIGVQLADALQAAHELSIIHRDLKPQNVLMNHEGDVKLLDFGIAKIVGESDHAPASGTETGMVMGTPGFIAPEQAISATEATIRSDVYGLGAVLYFCLTGRAPYTGGNPIEILSRIREGFPPPSSLRPDVPPALEAVLMRAMDAEPEKRHPSMAILGAELQALRDQLFSEEEAKAATLMVRPESDAEARSDQGYYLRVFYGRDDCREIDLGRGEWTIGRQNTCSIVLPHPTVSRTHALLRRERNHYIIEDLDSRCGTFVNGKKIKRAVLRPGHAVQISIYSLEFCARQEMGTVFRRSFQRLEGAHRARYRTLFCTPEQAVTAKDELPAEEGRIALRAGASISPSNCVELELTREGRTAVFVATVEGQIGSGAERMLCLRLHRVSPERLADLHEDYGYSNWIVVESASPSLRGRSG